MGKNTLLYTALILAVVLQGLNLLAISFSFYWLYWWYDVLMHFLAGVIGGLATYWVLFDSGIFGRRGQPGLKMKMLIVFSLVMVAGLLWEWMEYANGLTNSHEGYPLDPITDLFLDGVGALVATYIGLRKKNG